LALGPSAEGSASGNASVSTGSGLQASSSSRRSDKWIYRWAPERNMFELGLWFGLLIPNEEHEWYDPRNAAHNPYGPVAFDTGIRFAYFPLRFLGGEFEAGLMPTSANSERALLYTARGHLIGQLPWWSVTPFLVVGGGGMGVTADDAGVGKDIDASFHWGPGLKIFINRWIALRLDFRHLIGARQGAKNGVASHGEVLLGISVTFGRKGKDNKSEDEGDPDGDGYYGDDDACPQDPGVYPDGCPAPDRDDDGVADADDQCPDEPGPAPSGCPDDADRDEDGVTDSADQCPDVPGAKPSGCPPDTDGDGIADPDDQCIDIPGDPPSGCPPDPDGDRVYEPDDECPDEPETDNGFEDQDGCPDEVPDNLRGATGTLPGITFELNSAKIKPSSKPTLDEAARTLEANPDYLLEVEGHTDSTGSRQGNLKLSRERAESVKAYLVGKGIDADRITTKGVGPDQPVASNDTAEGRAENRRIEFKVKKNQSRRKTRRRRRGRR
jgi:OOP family OmpA-OmpF porin